MNQTKHTMNIQCKDCKILQIYFPVTYDSASTKIEAYFSFLSGIAFPGSSSKEIFAFSNPPISVIQNPTVVDTDQWTFGDLIKEYHRQTLKVNCILGTIHKLCHLVDGREKQIFLQSVTD